MKTTIFILALVLVVIGSASAAQRSEIELGELSLAASRGNEEALRSLEAEGAAGNLLAQNELGSLYGGAYEGFPPDLDKAKAWFAKAATAGQVDAQYNLGQMNLMGIGGPRDFEAAASWYRKAAAQNNPNALYQLGGMHINGDGVAKNPAEAKRLFEKAAALGHDGAKQYLQSMTKAAPGKSGGTTYRAVESPQSALAACRKDCVVYYQQKWVCVTRSEAAAVPYKDLGQACYAP